MYRNPISAASERRLGSDTLSRHEQEKRSVRKCAGAIKAGNKDGAGIAKPIRRCACDTARDAGAQTVDLHPAAEPVRCRDISQTAERDLILAFNEVGGRGAVETFCDGAIGVDGCRAEHNTSRRLAQRHIGQWSWAVQGIGPNPKAARAQATDMTSAMRVVTVRAHV